MKKLYTLLIACSISTGLWAQNDSCVFPICGNADWVQMEHNFDTNLPSWIKVDTSSSNIWQVGTPQKTFFGNAYSAPKAIMTDTINSYDTSAQGYFEVHTNVVDNWAISFKHKFQTDSLLDGGYIEVSIDSGQSWTNVLSADTLGPPISTGTYNLYTAQDTLINGEPGFSGTSGDWMCTTLSWVWYLPVRSALPVSLWLRFNFISDSIQTNKAGWIIDDIKVAHCDIGGSVNEHALSLFHSKAYPNPASGQVTIGWEKPVFGALSLTVYSPQGEIVETNATTSSTQAILNTQQYAAGVYYYQLLDANRKKSSFGKFVVE